MALQIARTRERIAHTAFTSELLELTEERPLSHDEVRRFISERHGHTPEDPEVEAAWTLATYEMQESVPSFEKAFSVAMENATIRMALLLAGLQWRVETVDAPILWTWARIRKRRRGQNAAQSGGDADSPATGVGESGAGR